MGWWKNWVTIDENAVKIVTELIARKDATVIAIMNQEAKEVRNMLAVVNVMV